MRMKVEALKVKEMYKSELVKPTAGDLVEKKYKVGA